MLRWAYSKKDALVHDVSSSPITTEQPQTQNLWRLDSDVEVDLDRIPMRIPSPELDLSVRPRTVRVCEDINTIHTLAPNQKPVTSDRVSQDQNSDGRNDKSRKGQAVSAETNPRQIVKQTDGERQHASQSNRRGSASKDRRKEKGRDGRDRPSESSRSTSRNKTCLLYTSDAADE